MEIKCMLFSGFWNAHELAFNLFKHTIEYFITIKFHSCHCPE